MLDHRITLCDGLQSRNADELATIMGWGFEHMQRTGPGAPEDLLADGNGGSLYLRLSTRRIPQPDREMTPELAGDVIAGGYWLRAPAAGSKLALCYAGAIAPEVLAAHAALVREHPGSGVLTVTSADRLYKGWQAAQRRREESGPRIASHVETLLGTLSPDAVLVAVADAHPASLSWLGGVAGHRVKPLGVARFGQSGSIPELYREYGIDAESIVEVCRTV